ncbi:MAG: hypothetical protein JWM34_5211 [Ilumatobacteraceae bacterium]|nr:hypothetical protein [Ilumatobacteraceae bacterium]
MDRSSASRRIAVEVDVSSAIPDAGPCAMRGWVMLPAALDAAGSTPMLYCQAGGGLGVGSWDLHVGGRDDFSMAEHFARRGAIVVALDHPGLGMSDPLPDLLALAPDAVVSAHAIAVAEIVERFRTGQIAGEDAIAVRPIGLGHSMGGMLTVMLQARTRCFERLVLLGAAGSGLADVLTDDELGLVGASREDIHRRVVELAARRFGEASTVPRRRPAHGIFFSDGVEPDVRRALAATGVAQLATCGLLAMIPGTTAHEMAAIDIPVFLGIGEHDIIADPHRVVASYPRSGDVRLAVLPGAGHAQNQEPNRHELWRRIERWIDE